MRLRTSHLIPLFISLAFPVVVQAKTLKETIVDALDAHPVLVRATERYASALETVKMDESGYFPTADLTLGLGKEWNYGNTPEKFTRREAAFSVTQMLYDGYETKSQVESSEAASRAEAARLEDQAEVITYQVAEVYLDVLRQRELLVTTEENLATHQDTYDKISRRAETGIGSSADQTQAKGRLALAQYNLTVVEGNLWESEINFERVVGYKPGDLEMPNDNCCELLPKTAEDARYLSLAETARFQAAVADHEASLSGIGVAKAAMHPKIHLEIDATSDKGADAIAARDSAVSAMVRLRQNLYRGGSDKAAIAVAQRNSERVRARGERDRRDLQADAEQSFHALERLYLQLPELERYEIQARGTRDAYVKQFTIGQRSLLDLLDSENEHFTASNDLISGRVDEQLSRYELLFSVGRLLEFFELVPPEHPEHRNDEGVMPVIEVSDEADAGQTLASVQ